MRHTIFTILSAILLSACTQQAKWRIGVSQCSDDDWRDKVNAEIRREAMFHPELEVVIRSGDDSNERQIEDIHWFMDQKFDLIIAAPNEADALTPVIKEVYDSGTPVIVFDRRINDRSYTAFVGADNEQIGINAAIYAHSVKGDTCRIIEICGLEGSTPAKSRRQGFDAKAEQLGLSIIAHGDGQWNRTVGTLVADSLLRAHPEANVIFAHNDHMAIAAAEVAHRQKRFDITVIGVDAAPTVGMKAVKDDKIDATFLYPTEGYTLVRTALDILEKKPYQHENIVGIPSAVDRSNVEILLSQNQLVKEETDKIERLQDALNEYWHQHSIQTALLWIVGTVALLLLAAINYLIYNYRVKARQRSEIEYQRDELHDLHSMIAELQEVVEAEDKLSPQRVTEPTRDCNSGTANIIDQKTSGEKEEAAEEKMPEESVVVQQFNRLVEKSLANSNLSVEDIAADMGISRVQLYRKVKSATGRTPVELIRTRRLIRADEMISSTSLTIAEIAYAVGFTSPSYFTKCYHEYFNRLPTDMIRGKSV